MLIIKPFLFQAAKKPPVGGYIGPLGAGNTGLQRPFPVISAESFLPGSPAGGGYYPGAIPPTGAGQFPANSYLPPPVPMLPSMPYPNMDPMSMMRPPAPPSYYPQYGSYSRRPLARRHHRRRRCRPVVHIIESSSCSSLSTCSSISSCSGHHHRSHSYSRRDRTSQQQQQQPIILLPIQCQQPPSAITSSIQGQQQQLALPPIQLNSSSFLPNNNSMSMIQPSISMPQITSRGQGQQFQAGPIQYVQAMPQPSSSTQLQYVSARPQSALVNSENKKQSATIKPMQRSVSTRNLPQNDLKFGRRTLDRHASDRKRNITNDNIRLWQQRATRVT